MLRYDNFCNDVKTEKDYESTQKAMKNLLKNLGITEDRGDGYL